MLPTYNRAQALDRAIGSVLAQVYPNFELIVVDDGSTSDISAPLKRHRDPKLRMVRLAERSGQAAARNAGIEAARHPLIAFQDSDDEWRGSDRLSNLAAALASGGDGCVLAYGGLRRSTRGEEPSEAEDSPAPPGGGILDTSGTRYAVQGIGIQTTLIKLSALREAGLFNVQLRALEDLELLLRLSKIGRFVKAAGASVIYRPGDDSVSRDYRALADARRKLLSLYAADLKPFPAFVAKELKEIAGLELAAAQTAPR